MTSLARRHLAYHASLAAAAAAAPDALPSPAEGAGASAYQLMQLRLDEDRRTLAAIQSREGKIAAKRQMLAAYDDWVAGVLAAGAEGRATQDDVFVEVMIWRIDVGDFAAAVPLAAHVLKFGLALPARYNRKPATLIVEEMADTALHQLKLGEPVDTRSLFDIEELAAGADIFDQVRAKLHKAIGLALLRDAENPPADAAAGFAGHSLKSGAAHLRRAMQLDAKAGVKKELEKAERALKASPPANDDAPGSTAGPPAGGAPQPDGTADAGAGGAPDHPAKV